MGDTVIDPCAGSGTTLRAAAELGRNAYGFEIKKDFYADSKNFMLANIQPDLFVMQYEVEQEQKKQMFKQMSMN